jgi:hypothetical protein
VRVSRAVLGGPGGAIPPGYSLEHATKNRKVPPQNLPPLAGRCTPSGAKEQAGGGFDGLALDLTKAEAERQSAYAALICVDVRCHAMPSLR